MLAKIHTETMDRTVDSLEQFDSLLKRICRKYAANPEIKMADGRSEKCGNAIGITRANGDMLMVVVGGDDGFVSFQPASLDEHAWNTIGDSNATGRFVFFVDGHWTEMQRRHAVSPATTLDVARLFLQMSEGPPSGVVWEQLGD